MNEVLIQSVIETVELQGKKIVDGQQEIQEVKATIEKLTDLKETVARLGNQVETLQTSIGKIAFPIKDMRELSRTLAEWAATSKRPIPHQHHHHIPMLAWITAGLFLVLSLVAAGWYIAGQKLEAYKASDTKYRYLKLDTSQPVLQKQLYQADSIFRTRTNLRDSIIQEEAARQQDYELRRKAAVLEQEAEALRGKTRK
jgi:hypothetical protein